MRTNRFNRTATWVVAGVALATWALLWSADAQSQSSRFGRENSWENYRIILQRNIFSRQRGYVQRERREAPRPVIIPNPETYFKLRGVAQEDGVFIAFIENTRDGGILQLKQGESVARGIVKALTLDSIEYEFEDKTITVAMGQDLEGGQGAVTMSELMQMSDMAAGAGTSGTTATPAPEPTGDEAAILQKLLERRRQQLGQ